MRENRTRGGRNKFGPIYRRDRALRRQLQIRRLQHDGALAGAGASAAYPNDRLFFPDFAAASLSRDVDVKPSAAELASLSAHNLASHSLAPAAAASVHRDDDFVTYHQRMWREAHDPGGSCSLPSDLVQSSFVQFGRETGGGAVVSPPSQRCSVDDAADVFRPRLVCDQDVTSRPSFYRRHQSYQPPGPYPSAPRYGLPPPHSSCASSGGPVAAANPPPPSTGFCAADVCAAEFAPAEMAQARGRHYQQQSTHAGATDQHPASAAAATFSQYRRPGASPLHPAPYQRCQPPHHPAHHHHQQPQPQRSTQQPPPPVAVAAAEARQLPRPDEPPPPVDSPLPVDGTTAAAEEFITEADVAARRLPGALKLINDLERRDARLSDAVAHLRRFTDDLLAQFHRDDDASLDAGGGDTRRMIVMACQLCDQALFVLVEWARHAHFFRQLPVRRSHHTHTHTHTHV